jgi:hypothetical protein
MHDKNGQISSIVGVERYGDLVEAQRKTKGLSGDLVRAQHR